VRLPHLLSVIADKPQYDGAWCGIEVEDREPGLPEVADRVERGIENSGSGMGIFRGQPFEAAGAVSRCGERQQRFVRKHTQLVCTGHDQAREELALQIQLEASHGRQRETAEGAHQPAAVHQVNSHGCGVGARVSEEKQCGSPVVHLRAVISSIRLIARGKRIVARDCKITGLILRSDHEVVRGRSRKA